MDGIANVARQQQSQVSTAEIQARVRERSQQTQHTEKAGTKQTDFVKEIQNPTTSDTKKTNSKEDVEDLVKKLNSALAPLSTNIQFGVDRDDVFYVAAIDAKTGKIIRRFPVEEANKLLPKMQEVTGILFDSKG